MRILIAEDDPSIMDTYKLLFGAEKHELHTANDGNECEKIFDKMLSETKKDLSDGQSKQAPPFDLVLLDYRMPGKNGMELAQHMLAVAPSQKIILASAYTQEMLASGEPDLKRKLKMIQKPFEFETLLNLVNGASRTDGIA
jgi:DNA-binding response OmpR family regulator